jgi:flagellar hook assembly protein FlgD
MYHDNRVDYSNEISVAVGQYFGVTLSTSEGRGQVAPGGSYYCPHTIANIGNGSDLYKMELSDTTSRWTSTLIKDENQNGIHDSSENTPVPNEVPLAEDANYMFFVVLTAPIDAVIDSIGSVKFKVSGLAAASVPYQGANGIIYGGPDTANSLVSAQVTRVDNPPTISNFILDGRKRYAEDIISAKPTVKAKITDDLPQNMSKIELTVNDAQVFQFTSADWKGAYDEASGEFSYQLGPLTAGTYSIKLAAFDKSNNSATESIDPLYVREDTGMIGKPINHPNPFRPLKGENTYIAYTLSTDMGVTLYIYDIRGSLLWKRTYQPFEEGGKAGYNEVPWSGKSDYSQVLGNGIYIFKIVHNNQVIGSGKIAILDTK